MAFIHTRTRADGSTVYQVRFRRGGRGARQESLTFESAEAAADFHGKYVKFGPDVALRLIRATSSSESITVAELVRKHIDSLSGVEPGTVKAYRGLAEMWIDPHPIAAFPVEAVAFEDVSGWVRWMEETPSATGAPLSAKSIRNRHALLSGAFSTAQRAKLRGDNPAAGVRLPKSTRREMTFLSRSEYDLMCKFIEPENRPLIELFVGTGLRVGEALALTVGSVDLSATVPQLTVSQAWKYLSGGQRLGAPKSKAGFRVVSLAPETTRAIEPLVKGRPAAEFVFGRHGKPLRPVWIYDKVWEPARRKAQANGLTKNPRLYDLRHTHASWLLAAGVPIHVVQRRLGHESIQTTVDRYGHLMDNALAVAAEATSRALRGE